MDMQIDRGRLDIEKIRLDIDETRQEIDLDLKRFKVQLGGMIAGMFAAIGGALATGAALGHYFTK